jgi:hypothetical protein
MSSHERRETVIHPPDCGPSSCRAKHVLRVERCSRLRCIAATTQRTGLNLPEARLRTLGGFTRCRTIVPTCGLQESLQSQEGRRFTANCRLNPLLSKNLIAQIVGMRSCRPGTGNAVFLHALARGITPTAVCADGTRVSFDISSDRTVSLRRRGFARPAHRKARWAATIRIILERWQ